VATTNAFEFKGIHNNWVWHQITPSTLIAGKDRFAYILLVLNLIHQSLLSSSLKILEYFVWHPWRCPRLNDTKLVIWNMKTMNAYFYKKLNNKQDLRALKHVTTRCWSLITTSNGSNTIFHTLQSTEKISMQNSVRDDSTTLFLNDI